MSQHRVRILRNILPIALLLFSAMAVLSQDIGLQLYSVRHQCEKDLEGTLHRVSEMGIHYVEGGGFDSYGLDKSTFSELLARTNLNMVSVGASFEELQDSVEKVVSRALNVKARYVVCFWVPHQDTIFGIEETQLAIDVFNEAGRKLKESGITLCYHPHGYEFRPYGEELLIDYMIKSSTYFDFEMDVYWVKHSGMDPVDLFNKYPDEFHLMHLKDRACGTVGNVNGRSDIENNVVLGKGDVGIKEIVYAAINYGKVKYMFIEDESSRSMEQIPASLAYLKLIMGLK